jgi:STE24 endopeptidase
MYNYIFYIILIVLIASFILDKVLDYLNLKNTVAVLPPEVGDVYEPERYKVSQEYKRVKTKFSFLTSSFSLILVLIMLFLGGFGYIDGLA